MRSHKPGYADARRPSSTVYASGHGNGNIKGRAANPRGNSTCNSNSNRAQRLRIRPHTTPGECLPKGLPSRSNACVTRYAGQGLPISPGRDRCLVAISGFGTAPMGACVLLGFVTLPRLAAARWVDQALSSEEVGSRRSSFCRDNSCHRPSGSSRTITTGDELLLLMVGVPLCPATGASSASCSSMSGAPASDRMLDSWSMPATVIFRSSTKAYGAPWCGDAPKKSNV